MSLRDNGKTKKAIWISYDLGIKGDYPNLYAWLDEKGAKEAGSNIAFLEYKITTNDDDNLLETIKCDLKDHINFKRGDRIYVIRSRFKDGKHKVSGTFLIGNRKASPWEGFGQKGEDIEDIIDEDE